MTQPMPSYEPLESAGGRDFLHDRRALALIGAAVVAVGAAGYFVVLPMLGGSSSTSADALVPHAHVKASASATPTPGAPAAPATVAPALQVRDPFSPLYVAAVAASGGAAAGSISGGGGVAPVVPSSSAAPTAPALDGGAQTYVVQEPGPTTTVTTTAKPTQAAPKYTLKLTKVIDGSHVQVTINGKPYTVATGSNVPDAKQGPFRLSSVAVGGPAQFMYGDATFAMSVGETQTEN